MSVGGGDEAELPAGEGAAPPPPREALSTDPREPARSSRGEAALIAGLVTAATALAVAHAFGPERAGNLDLLASMGVVYVALTAVTVLWLRRRGELRATLRPLSGDLARGAFVAALLYGVAMAGHQAVTGRGSPREGWILRVYLQLGDPAADARVFLGAAVFVLAAMEEVVWRGFVMRALEGPLGRQGGLLLSSALFAAAHLPTMFLLRDPAAGLNPLIVAAGFGCSMVWGRLFQRAERLAPAVFAHAFFTWAIVSFPIWRP
jgi:uncharacterized protein